MSDVAILLNPPSPRTVFRDHYCASEAKSAYLWHPLDLQIQAAWLKEAGWEVKACDAVALEWGPQEVGGWARAAGARAAVVLVSERTWEGDKATIDALRGMGIPQIAASGDFLRFGAGPIDEARGRIDWVLTDFTTGHLSRTLREGEAAGPGVTTVDEVAAGRFHDLGRALLDFPTPDPDLFAPARYRLPYPGFTPIASALTTYGCPHHCRYCHVGELGARLRPVDDIVTEVRQIRAAGYQRIYFRDATLNANRTHLLEWTRRLCKEDLATPWAAFAAALPMDDALAHALAMSGCKHLQIGVETLADGLRDHNGKPFDGDAHRAFVDTCHRAGIEVTAHLVLGLPGEDEASLAATVEGLAEAPFDYVAVNLAEDRPGLPWRAEGVRLPLSPSGARPAGATGPSAEGLKEAQRLAYKRFYLRPRRLTREVVARLAHRDVTDIAGLAGGLLSWARPPRRT